MAGIEKICEFSGDYPRGMYGYKRNQLQICPKYRKLFRGATAVLKYKLEGWDWVDKHGSYTEFRPNDRFNYSPPYSYEDWVTLNNVLRWRLRRRYEYCLVVEDEHLQGRVEGEYWNTTHDLSTVKRKLKRLLRCKDLQIERL